MPLSYVTYSGAAVDGIITKFSVTFAYIDSTHVYVYLDGVLQTLTTDYTWFNSTTIEFNTAPTSGTLVRLQRTTPSASRLVDFQDAGNLTEFDLDTSAEQNFMLSQESQDDFTESALSLAADGKWDAESIVIKNLADGVASSDAANVGQVTSLTAADAAAAAASAAAALVSEGLADADATATAADVVLTNADVVLTHADVVLTAADAIATAADAAATAADLLLTDADQISCAADAASTAADAIATAADAVSTAADVTTTTTLASNASASAAAALVSENAAAADAILTAADAVSTAADVIAAEAADDGVGTNTQTGTSYVPVLGDAGDMITMNNAAANTVTIPANASVAYPVDTELHFMQLGAGQTTIAITTDTLNVEATLTLKLVGQYATATAKKMTSTMWVLFGNLEAAP